MEKILFIVNPVSGGKDKKTLLAAIARHLDLSRYTPTLMQTTRPGEAEQWARESDAPVVVAVGGDGTVSEVARGLMGSEKKLGIIPCGSGDGLALHLGISRDPGRAVQVLNDAQTVRMDAGRINDRLFFCTAGVGMDADVSWAFSQSKQRGLATYVTTAWEEWKHYKPQHYRIESDDWTWEGEAVFLTVANANQWGNEARIAPGASLRDGLFDIAVVLPFHTLEIPDLATRLLTGKADTSRRLLSFRASRLKIHRQAPGPAHFDGDPFEAGCDLTLEILPAALPVLVPNSRKERV